MKTRRRTPKSLVQRLTFSLPMGCLLASGAALLPVCVYTAAAANRTYAIDGNGSFSTFPDTNQRLNTFDFTLFRGAGAGAAVTVNSNVADLYLGTGTSGSTINGNAIAFGLPANNVPTRFTILNSPSVPLLNIAGNVVNNSGVLQTLSTNLAEAGVPKNNGIYGYIFDSGTGGLVINGTIGTGTVDSPSSSVDLRKYGTGTLTLNPPINGGNNLSTSTIPDIGSLTDAVIVGRGTLLIEGGAKVAARVFTNVGQVAGENGTLVVNGTLAAGDSFNSGDQNGATGSATLNPGGSLTCNNSFVGKNGNGTLNLAGGDFTATGYTSIGTYGGSQGTFVFNDGSYTDTGDFNLADVTGSTGTMVLNNGLLQIATLYVGKGGGGNGSNTVGILTQNGGYILRTADGGSEWRIGGGNSGTPQTRGTYNMNGGALQTASAFQVGAFGIGTLNQTGGTIVVNSYLDAGRFDGCNGTINVTGGTLNQADATARLFAAERGTGTINVGRPAGVMSGPGGTIITSGGLAIGYGAGAIGTFNLNAGGLLQAPYVGSAVDPGLSPGGGTSTFNFNGGTLKVLNSGAAFNGTVFFQDVTRTNVQAGGAIIDTGNESVLALQSFSHDNASGAPALDGGLTKLGGGSLTLGGGNTYTGGTFVNAGTLQISSDTNLGATSGGVTVGNGGRLNLPASFATSRALTVNTGGTINGSGTGLTVGGSLNGGGTVNGAITISNGGTLGGPVTINGNLTIASGGQAVLTSGGTLRVNGDLVNSGFMLLGRGTVLALANGRTFTNNGTLDVSTGSFTTPAGFVNRGVVIDSSVVRVRTVTRATNGVVTLTIDTYTGHNYRLQRATALTGAAFADVAGVAAKTGSTGTAASFTDPNPPAGSGFYRVAIDP